MNASAAPGCHLRRRRRSSPFGSEATTRHPAVVVSNDHTNAAAARTGRGVVGVVPLTSNTAQAWPFQVLLPPERTGLDRVPKVQAEQVRSVAVERAGVPVGRRAAQCLAAIDEALRLHMAP
ncbi:type II toxin-antitoxin system PemK/MazF family toxin [Quadrisphaera granulorum]|uniref:type II toxin-antitoxin system PemK/MazF family toxin n=1 Tax=Quadrisphaera granulorum TaxID=317664 RepID=UPI000D6AB3C3